MDKKVRVKKTPVSSKSLGMKGMMTGLQDKETSAVEIVSVQWIFDRARAHMTQEQLQRLKVNLGMVEEFVRTNYDRFAALTSPEIAEELLEILPVAKDALYKNVIDYVPGSRK